jgi:hypothetical protein
MSESTAAPAEDSTGSLTTASVTPKVVVRHRATIPALKRLINAVPVSDTVRHGSGSRDGYTC